MSVTRRPAARAVVIAPLLLSVACSDGVGPSSSPFFADRLAFSQSADGGGVRLFTAEPDGSDVRPVRLSAGALAWYLYDLAWGPGHSRLAFAASPQVEGAHTDLYVVNPSEGEPVNLTNTPDIDEDAPTWSPDGRQVAFRRAGRIWVMNANGSDKHELVGLNENGTGNTYPAWSPDGATILYKSDVGELWAVGTIGPAVPQLVRPFSALISGKPSWSPDGGTILLWEVPFEGSSAFRLIPTNGGETRSIPAPLGPYHPTWSPDGTRIAFIPLEGDGEIRVLTLASSETVSLGIRANEVAWK